MNPPCVMVDGILYQDTGFVDSMVRCGNMDGEIDSAVDATELTIRKIISPILELV